MKPAFDRTTDPVAEKVEWLTEGLIQIGPWRIGLDPLVGLVPGLGDLVMALAAMIIVQRAIALRIPKPAIARMVLNVVIDAVVGAIPFLGDAFDFAFKANTKNLRILRESLAGTRRSGRDWLFLILVALVLAACLLVPVVVFYYVLRAVLPSRTVF